MLSHPMFRALALAVALAACSSTTESDAAKVYRADSAGFTLRVWGGFPPPAMPGGCSPNDYTLTWTSSTGVLRWQGCYSQRPVDRAVTLDAAGRAAITAAAAALSVSAERGCGADAPDLSLVVRDAGGTSTTYNSTFYAGCAGRSVAAPFIAFDALSRFGAELTYLFSRCAGTTDAGLTCGDAGTSG